MISDRTNNNLILMCNIVVRFGCEGCDGATLCDAENQTFSMLPLRETLSKIASHPVAPSHLKYEKYILVYIKMK